MKALINKKSILIVSIAVLIAVITIFSVNVFSSAGPVTGLANTISRPVRALSSNVTSIFERIYASTYRYNELLEDYERVVRENADYQRNLQESEDLAAENATLRTQLGFRLRHPNYVSDHAMVRGWSGSNWSSSFAIDIGYANSNIVSGNAVITEYGVLIGKVTEVSATESTVVTVLDTTFSAGAIVGDGTATVKGDFNLMRAGLIMLDHIDDDQIVLRGDSVVTSGGGVFPAGLIVGEVLDVHRHDTGVGRYATVRPTRIIDTISEVFVITGFEPVVSGFEPTE